MSSSNWLKLARQFFMSSSLDNLAKCTVALFAVSRRRICFLLGITAGLFLLNITLISHYLERQQDSET
ncbi:hypothetical protein AAVH_37828, partial [Aphelenchoides avenae]